VPGKIITDEHEISVSADAPSGDYVIEIGMVQADTGQRLSVTDEDGHLLTEGLRLEGQFYWFNLRNDTDARFAWPTSGFLSQTAGDGHPAVDIASLTGTPVCAAADGTVLQVDHDADYGIHVLLDHGDGYNTLYAHLGGAGVRVGDQVTQGRQIGVIGNTGQSTGPHLHFEVRKNGKPVDPFAVMAEEEARGQVSSVATPETKTMNGLNSHGIQAHMLGQDAAPSLEAVQELGFGWAKQQVQWKYFEPRDGDYRWSELDALVAAADTAGIKLLWSVVNAPEWARSGQELAGTGPPHDPLDLADFLGAMAERYCGSNVGAIEVWDEQNVPFKWGNMAIDPAAYMRLLKPAYERIKSACPGMTVVSGGLSPTSASSSQAMGDVLYLEGMYQNGLKDFSDAIGIHLPTYNWPPDAEWETHEDSSAHFRDPFQRRDSSWSFRGTAEEYRRVMEAHGDAARPVWVTQFGWAVANDPPRNYEYAADNTVQEQAEFTLRAFEMAREWGWVEAMFLWNLNFSVVAPGSAQAMWSIVGPGWEHTLTFKMLAEME
jgi:murein DD-endopeptidase MepM/ murein hydrolase activator NlpD